MYVYGADCELGYGYDRGFGYIVRFECNPRRRQGFNITKWFRNTDLLITENQILNQNYLNVLENQLNIEGDEDDYYNIFLIRDNSYEQCSDCDKYPETTANFIYKINYGLFINVIIKKDAFPNTRADEHVLKLIQNKLNLSLGQEKLQCYVVINGKENYTWTLKEFVKFCRDHGDDKEYQCATSIDFKKIGKKNDTTIYNKDKVVEFLKYLYLCYRKLEFLLLGHELFEFYETDFDTNDTLTEDDVNSIIKSSIEKYRMNIKNSNVVTYVALKRLFHSYKLYLEYCIIHGKNIIIKDNVIDVQELKLLWKKLISPTLKAKLDKKKQLEYEGRQILNKISCQELQNFLELLKKCIKKIEFGLDDVGYTLLEDDEVILNKNMRLIVGGLEKSIEEYQKMPRTSFLNMYPTMKKLYWNFVSYIKLHATYNIPLDEKIPGTINELNLWFRKLNSWYLRKVGDTWIESDEPVIYINENNTDLGPLLNTIMNDGKIKILPSQIVKVDEKFFTQHPETDGSIGLFKFKSCSLTDIDKRSDYYESKCPSKECPDVMRKWMCIACRELLKVKQVSCECQDYELNQLDFVCPSIKHSELTEAE